MAVPEIYLNHRLDLHQVLLLTVTGMDDHPSSFQYLLTTECNVALYLRRLQCKCTCQGPHNGSNNQRRCMRRQRSQVGVDGARVKVHMWREVWGRRRMVYYISYLHASWFRVCPLEYCTQTHTLGSVRNLQIKNIRKH